MLENKKVLVYCYDLNTYGIKVIIDNICCAFKKLGYTVDITSKIDSKELLSYLFIIPVTINSSYNLLKYKNIKHDISFLMDSTSLCSLSTGYFFLKQFYFFRAFKEFFKFINYFFKEYVILKKYCKIIVVSNCDKHYLDRIFNSNKVEVVMNGVTLPIKIEHELKISDDIYPKKQLILGHLTSFSPMTFQYIKWFIENIMKPINEVYNYKLLVAGRGATVEMIDYFKSHSNIDYIGEVDSIDDFFSRIDIFISTVFKDCGILNKILDSFIHKKLVLGLDNNFKAFCNLQSGVHYLSFSNLENCLSAIDYFIRNNDEMNNIIENAYSYALEHHNWETNYEALPKIQLHLMTFNR